MKSMMKQNMKGSFAKCMPDLLELPARLRLSIIPNLSVHDLYPLPLSCILP